MLDVYWGEFLTSPIPLECSLNYCSHKCAFCFANLNQPDREANAPAIMRLLADYPNRKTLTAKFLQAGYPVVVSNRVDPFAHSNYQQALPIMRQMTDLGIPIALQTRGGKGADEALDFLKPAVWYISINTDSEPFRKKLEPGATPIDYRFDLMRELVRKGHRVVLGFNPCVPEWSPRPRAILERAKDAGAEGAWIERLHLNPKQEKNLTAKERAVIGDDVIRRAKMRHGGPQDQLQFKTARRIAEEIGLPVFSKNQPNRSDFFKPWRDLYPSIFPTMQEFVNACHDTGQRRFVFHFGQFADFILPDLLGGVLEVGHYLGATAHNLWDDYKFSNHMTYKQLLELIWKEPRISFCPANLTCFAYLGKQVEGEWEGIVDEFGLPFMVFDASGGLTSYYATAETEKGD